jgi:hypothetical protein
VTVALSTKKWRRLVSKNPRKFETLSGMVDHWLTAHDILAADLPHLNRALVIHYERLVSQPDTELSRVEEFLGLSSPIDRSSFTAEHSSSYAQWWEQLRSPWRAAPPRRGIALWPPAGCWREPDCGELPV